MAYEVINVGSLPNDGSGDPLRVAYIKINNNFAVASNLTPSGSNGDVQFKLVSVNGNVITDSFSSSANLNFNPDEGNFYIGANIMPLVDDAMSIGDPVRQVGNLYLSPNALNIGNINITEDANIMNFNVAVFPSLKADIVVGGINYGASPNTTIDTHTFITNTTSPIAIYAVPTSGFSAGKFDITSKEANSNNSQTVTLVALLSSDNTNVSFTAFNTLISGNAVTTYDMDVSANSVRVIVSPFVSSTITHNISYKIDT